VTESPGCLLSVSAGHRCRVHGMGHFSPVWSAALPPPFKCQLSSMPLHATSPQNLRRVEACGRFPPPASECALRTRARGVEPEWGGRRRTGPSLAQNAAARGQRPSTCSCRPRDSMTSTHKLDLPMSWPASPRRRCLDRPPPWPGIGKRRDLKKRPHCAYLTGCLGGLRGLRRPTP